MNKMVFLIALGFVFNCMALSAQAQEICADQKNGWKSACLRDQSQIADEIQTRTYWDLQAKIKTLSETVRNPAYVTQLKSLLRKNELDFINYSESYCNMQVVLSDADTDINKMLNCQISTSMLRNEELKSIIEFVDQKQKSSK